MHRRLRRRQPLPFAPIPSGSCRSPFPLPWAICRTWRHAAICPTAAAWTAINSTNNNNNNNNNAMLKSNKFIKTTYKNRNLKLTFWSRCNALGHILLNALLIVLVVLLIRWEVHAILVFTVCPSPRSGLCIGCAAAAVASIRCGRGSGMIRLSLGLIRPAPLGASILKPGLHLPIGQLQLQRQMPALLGRQVLGAGEAILEIFRLLWRKADLAALPLHAKVRHVKAGGRICRIAVEGGGSSRWIAETYKSK